MASFTWVNPRVKLMRKTKIQLQAICSNRGITFDEKATKGALVDLICPEEDAKRETNAIFRAAGATEPVHPEVE